MAALVLTLAAASLPGCGRRTAPQPFVTAHAIALRVWQREQVAVVAWPVPPPAISTHFGGLIAFRLTMERLSLRCVTCAPEETRVLSLAPGDGALHIERKVAHYTFSLPETPTWWRFRMVTRFASGSTTASEPVYLEAPAQVPQPELRWEWVAPRTPRRAGAPLEEGAAAPRRRREGEADASAPDVAGAAPTNREPSATDPADAAGARPGADATEAEQPSAAVPAAEEEPEAGGAPRRVRLYWEQTREAILRGLNKGDVPVEREIFYRANLYRRRADRPWPMLPLNPSPLAVRQVIFPAPDEDTVEDAEVEYALRLVDRNGNEGAASEPVTISGEGDES